MQTATLSNSATPRYGYAPQVMFAATRAGAERRVRETAAAAASPGPRSRSIQNLVRSLAARLAGSTS